MAFTVVTALIGAMILSRSRFNELIAGVRADVAVKVFGDDVEVFLEAREEIAEVLERVAGAADVKVRQITGLPDGPEGHGLLRLECRRCPGGGRNRFGRQEGREVFEGDRRFDLVVRLPEVLRIDLNAIQRLPLLLPAAGRATLVALTTPRPSFVPLGAVAEVSIAPGSQPDQPRER